LYIAFIYALEKRLFYFSDNNDIALVTEVEDKVSKYTVRDYSSTKMHINLKTS